MFVPIRMEIGAVKACIESSILRFEIDTWGNSDVATVSPFKNPDQK